MSTVRRGNAKELRVAHHLETHGWLVASRRHIPGPGDLLAVKSAKHVPRLIEVKATAAGPFAGFGKADRRAMIQTAWKHGCVPELAWWPPRAREPTFYRQDDWPPTPPLSSPSLAAVA